MAYKKGESGNINGKPKGAKAKKTILREGLGLTSTKDIPAVVIKWANELHKKADGDFNKEIQIWKELAKAGLPKTVVNVEEGFEEFVKRFDDTN